MQTVLLHSWCATLVQLSPRWDLVSLWSCGAVRSWTHLAPYPGYTHVFIVCSSMVAKWCSCSPLPLGHEQRSGVEAEERRLSGKRTTQMCSVPHSAAFLLITCRAVLVSALPWCSLKHSQLTPQMKRDPCLSFFVAFLFSACPLRAWDFWLRSLTELTKD